MQWQWIHFSQLKTSDYYHIMRARAQVFVVEQGINYVDADPYDLQAWHLLGWKVKGDRKELAAYLRVLPPGLKNANPTIGRVLTTASYRGHGLGKELLATAITYITEQWPQTPIQLSAQYYLKAFYESFGFKVISEPFYEEGIKHCEMLRD